MYEVATASGRHAVVARRWWHPTDRRVARLAAKVLDQMEPLLEAEVRARSRNLLLYGPERPGLVNIVRDSIDRGHTLG